MDNTEQESRAMNHYGGTNSGITQSTSPDDMRATDREVWDMLLASRAGEIEEYFDAEKFEVNN